MNFVVGAADATTIFGRPFPRASAGERMAWAIVLVGCVLVLVVAAQLNPDLRGVGTHEQIPFLGPTGHFPPCGFYETTGYPCPSCGFTTTFAFAMHGRVLEAAHNQPFGFVVWLGFCTTLPVALASVLGGVSPLRATDHWRWRWILTLVVLGWLAGWLYKIWVLRP